MRSWNWLWILLNTATFNLIIFGWIPADKFNIYLYLCIGLADLSMISGALAELTRANPGLTENTINAVRRNW